MKSYRFEYAATACYEVYIHASSMEEAEKKFNDQNHSGGQLVEWLEDWTITSKEEVGDD